MGCGCKKNVDNSDDSNKSNFTENIIFKFILFLISIPILTILYPVVIILLFRSIVLGNSSVNLVPMITKLAKKFNKNKSEDNEDDGEDEIDPDDYELIEKVDEVK